MVQCSSKQSFVVELCGRALLLRYCALVCTALLTSMQALFTWIRPLLSLILALLTWIPALLSKIRALLA